MLPELLITVRQIATEEILVRVELCPAGASAGEERFEVSLQLWRSQAESLGFPQQGVARGQSLGALLKKPPTVTPLQLGQILFRGIFRETIATAWQQSLAIARSQQQPLRLRLCLIDRELAALPWELMHDGQRELATAKEIWLSRCDWQSYISKRLPNPPTPGRPSILIAISEPADRPSLDLQKEVEQLQAVLKGQPIRVLPQPDRRSLTEALLPSTQIWHYAGHSDTRNRGGILELVGADGLTQVVTGEEIGGLVERAGVQLAVLNSCRSATLDSEQNLTEVLLRRGVGAVVAMADRIDNDVALAFSQAFYSALSEGEAIDQAAATARQRLLSTFSENLPCWALPIVYLHGRSTGTLPQSPSKRFVALGLTFLKQRPWPVALLLVAALTIGVFVSTRSPATISQTLCDRALLGTSLNDNLDDITKFITELKKAGCPVAEYSVRNAEIRKLPDPTVLASDVSKPRGDDPNPVAVALAKGDQAAQTGQWETAISFYVQAREMSANPTAIWLRLSIAYAKTQQIELSRQALQKVVDYSAQPSQSK
jgi:CHAT domain